MNVAKCKECGTDAYMPFTCSRCGEIFCTKHRINHACNKSIVIEAIKEKMAGTVKNVQRISENTTLMGKILISNAITSLRGSFKGEVILSSLIVGLYGAITMAINLMLGVLTLSVVIFITSVLSWIYHDLDSKNRLVERFMAMDGTVISVLSFLWKARAMASSSLSLLFIACSIAIMDWVVFTFAVMMLIIALINIKRHGNQVAFLIGFQKGREGEMNDE